MIKGDKAPPRVVALVGPFGSGKTTLVDTLLSFVGKTRRPSKGERVFRDAAVDAAAMSMGTALNVAAFDYLGDDYVFLDCPGSIEFMQESRAAIRAADVAVVVAEPEPDKLQALTPILHELEGEGIPHLVFINKVDRSHVHIRDLVRDMEAVSALPLVLRQVPLRENGEIAGYVDLAAQRTYHYRDGAPSDRIEMPGNLEDQVAIDRFDMLERLADFHDHLMEELLDDVEPPLEEVFDDLAADMAGGRIMPVLMGSAEHGYGLMRLMKALRHEIPSAGALDRSLCLANDADPALFVIKQDHVPHLGRTTLARVLAGPIKDGSLVGGMRVNGMAAPAGLGFEKTRAAGIGDIVQLSRFGGVRAGDALGADIEPVAIMRPVYGQALSLSDQKDEAKLSDGLMKITDQDPSLEVSHQADTAELVLWGQGEIHLKAAQLRLATLFGVHVGLSAWHVPYRETIRAATTQHSRYKKQTGGHGQFGDVVIDVKPRAKGSGFAFESKVTGGAIPRQYIPSVEAGVKDCLSKGPLGFPVVDVAVTLKDGSYHTVDSSDMAFKTAGRMAIAAALPDCDPVLLEPIERVKVMAPNSYTNKINSLIASRRGQILTFDMRPGWPGWDQVEVLMPQSQMRDLIIELRSLTQGTGTFDHHFDHLAEISGRLRDQAIADSQ